MVVLHVCVFLVVVFPVVSDVFFSVLLSWYLPVFLVSVLGSVN